jgi:hypothetical protein
VGNDFIETKAKKPLKKAWLGGVDAMKQPSLLDLQIAESNRTVTMRIHPGTSAGVGAEYRLQVEGSEVLVIDVRIRVGALVAPPADVLERLADAGGIGIVKVVRIGTFGDTADVVVFE